MNGECMKIYNGIDTVKLYYTKNKNFHKKRFLEFSEKNDVTVEGDFACDSCVMTVTTKNELPDIVGKKCNLIVSVQNPDYEEICKLEFYGLKLINVNYSKVADRYGYFFKFALR